MKNQNQNKELIIEDNKLLKGILFALLDGKDRDTQAEILRKTGLNKNEIVNLLGPSEATLRVRKHREEKKNDK